MTLLLLFILISLQSFSFLSTASLGPSPDLPSPRPRRGSKPSLSAPQRHSAPSNWLFTSIQALPFSTPTRFTCQLQMTARAMRLFRPFQSCQVWASCRLQNKLLLCVRTPTWQAAIVVREKAKRRSGQDRYAMNEG